MKEAIIVFDSTEERFKKPYGAVQSGQVLHLRVYAHDLAGIQSMRTVILYDRHQIPAIYEMTSVPCSQGKYTPYEITFPVYDTGLYWYFFEITTEDGTYHWLEDGMQAIGWQEIDGKLYCFGEDGLLITNSTLEKDGVTYKIQSDGTAVEK